MRLVEEAAVQEKKAAQRQVQTTIRLDAGARAARNELDLRGMMT